MSTQAQSPEDSKVPLILKLPVELQHEIFSYVVPHVIRPPTTQYRAVWQTASDRIPILRVCRALSDAALDYMYSKAIIDVYPKSGLYPKLGLRFLMVCLVDGGKRVQCVRLDKIGIQNRRRICGYNLNIEEMLRYWTWPGFRDNNVKHERGLHQALGYMNLLVNELQQASCLDLVQIRVPSIYRGIRTDVDALQPGLNILFEPLRRLRGVRRIEFEGLDQGFREDLIRDMMRKE